MKLLELKMLDEVKLINPNKNQIMLQLNRSYWNEYITYDIYVCGNYLDNYSNFLSAARKYIDIRTELTQGDFIRIGRK